MTRAFGILTAGGSLGAGVSLRGLGQKFALELVNGRRTESYGSDAIAGVINVILRKDHRGMSVGGSCGRIEGKNEYHVSMEGGVGDFVRDGSNVPGTIDWFKREADGHLNPCSDGAPFRAWSRWQPLCLDRPVYGEPQRPRYAQPGDRLAHVPDAHRPPGGGRPMGSRRRGRQVRVGLGWRM